MSSKFRTEIRRYWIYCILDEIMETVFVGKSYAKNPKAHYYSHLRGEHSLTRDAYADADVTEPGFYLLEVLYTTGRIAFKHVLAWYVFFEEYGYAILTEEKAGYMVDNMSFDTQKIYDEVCAPYTLSEVLSRQVSVPIISQSFPEKEVRKKEDADTLIQLNVRVKTSIAQSFRAFCTERNLSQSDGLRLLLQGEDFNTRELVMQSYLREINSKNAEITYLEEKNRELAQLQNGKETWILHHRKEWIRIARHIIGYMIEYSDLSSPELTASIRPYGIKSIDGHKLFNDHRYPSAGGCYTVTITGLVRGFSRRKHTPEQYSPLFICAIEDDNTPIKMRYYPKSEYIGIPPAKWNLTYWGDHWLLCCIIAKDGAADLVCSLPLSRLCQSARNTPQCDDEHLDLHIDKQLPSLDTMIADAKNRYK